MNKNTLIMNITMSLPTLGFQEKNTPINDSSKEFWLCLHPRECKLTTKLV